MNPKLKAIFDEIEAKNKIVTDIFDNADAKNNGDVTPEEKAKVIATNKEIEQLELRAIDFKDGEAMRAAAEERKAQAARNRLPFNDMDGKNGDDKGDGRDRGSDRYREARKSGR